MRNIGLTTIAVSALLLSGCGGGSSDTVKSTKDLLLGKTLYSADANLVESTGYYKDIYGESTIQETEHAEDGTQIFQPLIFNVSYSETTITVSFNSISTTCRVSESDKGVIFDCDDGNKFQQWYQIADIVR